MHEKKTKQKTFEQRVAHDEYRARVNANRERRKIVEKDKEQDAWQQLEMPFEEED